MARNGCLIALVVVVAGGAVLYERHAATVAEERRQAEELRAGVRASEVLSATFGREASLRVATLTGRVRSQGACLSADVISNTQTTIAPYSVAYSVDLGQVGQASYRWDAHDRTMFVELPGITAETPTVDIGAARTAQTGLFVSRACGIAMQQQVAGLLRAAAADRSVAPAYLAQARDAARVALERMTQAPLAAAGLGQVTVRIRFATDPRPQDDRPWDVSRSIGEVLADPRLHGAP